MRLLKCCALIAVALLALSPCVQALDYPTRTVTIVVPFAPGGSADIGARMFAQKLTERLGKPVVVENRAGAGTVIGSSTVAKAAPDGYTLLMGGSSALVINPTLYKQLPYDPTKDFVPLALIAGIPFVLVAQPSLPVQSAADLVKLAKEKPGQLSFATAGPGSPAHLQTELLKTMTGIDVILIPYKSSGPAITDFVGGRIPAMFVDVPPSLPLIREGKMRALGVSSRTRVPAAPEIPPLAETGVPGFDAGGWLMFVAPAQTPKEIVNRLHTELKAVAAQDDIRRRLSDMGMIPIDTLPLADLSPYVNTELQRWAKIMQQAGIAGSQ